MPIILCESYEREKESQAPNIHTLTLTYNITNTYILFVQ